MSVATQVREIGQRLKQSEITEDEAARLLAMLQREQGGASGRQTAAQKRYANRRRLVAEPSGLRDVSVPVTRLDDDVRERFGLKGPASAPLEVVPVVPLPHTWPARLTQAEFDLLVIGSSVFARPKVGGSARPLYQLHASQVLLRW